MSLVQGRGAADLLKEDLLASICFEVIHLGVGVLVSGADPCVSDFSSHRSERVCVSGRLAEKQPNALSERILGLLFAVSPAVCFCRSNSGVSEHLSVAMANTHVLMEGFCGRWLVDESRRPMDLSVSQGRQGMGQETQGLCGYGSSDA